MKLLLSSILFFAFGACFAQKLAPLSLRFEHLDEKDGLSNNSVNCIFKDRDGYIWFGTDDGLDRYDGTSFKIYRHNNKDSTTIAGNEIKSIAGDPSGGLWVDAQCRGLTHLNTYSGKGITLKTQRGSDTLLQTNCDVQFCMDDEGNTWVRNYENLSKYDPATKRFTPVYRDPEASPLIYRILCHKNIVWLGEDQKLEAFDTHTNKVTDYSKLVPGAPACIPLLIDAAGNMLAGSYGGGLYVLNPATGKTNHLFNGMVISAATEVTLNGRKQIWICTDHGLRVVDEPADLFTITDASFTSYNNDSADLFSISSNSIVQVLQDNNGIIWIATSNGVDKLNPAYLRFQDKVFSGTEKNIPVRYDANDMFISKNKAGEKRYWFSYWHDGGLVETDDRFHVLKHLEFKHPLAPAPENANVSNVFAARDGNLWIATWDGLWKYDQEQEKLLQNYKLNDHDTSAYRVSAFDYGAEDASGNVWLGTYNQYLHVLNPATGTFTKYPDGAGKVSPRDNRTDFLFFDSKHRMWSGDVSFYDFQKKEFIKPVLEGTVSDIIEDHKGDIWLATENGIAHYNESEHNFTVYGVNEGLAGASIQSLLTDDENNIWAGTTNGLSFLNTGTNTIRNFTVSDGLPANGLGHILKLLPDGNILLNYDVLGKNGLISFDPKQLLAEKQEIPFHFTFFNISGKALDLQNSPDSIGLIDLSYKDNVLTIGFSALAFTGNINLRYRYRLNSGNAWTELGKENTITLTGLRSGNYGLYIQATDNNGRWMEKTLQLNIIVHPPFWRTWWFSGLILLLAGIIIFYFVRRRIKNIKQAAAVKQEITALEIKALKAQMNPHFVFNSLTSIQESIVHGKTEAASKYLGKFARLIRAILENSEKKFITLEQEIDYLRLYLELESFRFDDLNFEINTSGITDTSFVRIPAMLIQPFVENAIKHGLSHKEGLKKVTVSFSEHNDHMLEVKVEDNGIGRTQSALINRSRISSHQSMGMKITAERLQLQEQGAPDIRIIDCSDDTGKASGTCVIIYISTEKQY